MATALREVTPLLKLELGCGKKVKDGFEGVDLIDYGQKYIHDLRQRWPWGDNSIGEVNTEHFVEHLDGTERVFFFNELYRVMAAKATANIVTPNWTHSCAYGDPTHKWPPMSAWYPLYLHKPWREINAPHVGYTCDFDWTIAGSWDQRHEVRNQEFKMYAMNNYVDSLRDLIVTLTKRP